MMIKPYHHATVDIPSWDPSFDDPMAHIFSPQTNKYFSALQRYLPSSTELSYDSDDPEFDSFDSFSSDEFMLYEFKVRKCPRPRSHDWTECPYAHPGEKARRRDPRKYKYSGEACSEFRRNSCRKGDSCEYAHGVFESWLHPSRYRTQPCKDGPHCQRRVCFFAHSPEQLRVLPHTTDSPQSNGSESMSELAGLMQGLSMNNMSPRSPWGIQMGGSGSGSGSGFGSPRTPIRSGFGLFDPWDMSIEEEPVMERVESGKNLRAEIYGKLSKDNSVESSRVDSVSQDHEFEWVSELIK